MTVQRRSQLEAASSEFPRKRYLPVNTDLNYLNFLYCKNSQSMNLLLLKQSPLLFADVG